jgi:hypothetical protein
MVSPASILAMSYTSHKIKKPFYKSNPYQRQYASLSKNCSNQQSTTLRIHLAKELLHVTFLPKMDKIHSPHKPLCHQFKGQSNSSRRVDIAKHLLVNECTLTAAGIVSSRTATYRNKKQEKLQHFDHLSLSDSPSYDPTKITFFVTSTIDTYFESQIKTITLQRRVQFEPVSSLQIIDTDNGCCHNMAKSLTFAKLPRTWALHKSKNVSDDATTLERLLRGHKLERGTSHLDISKNYRTFGMFCSRNSASIQRKEDLSTSNISLQDKQQLQFMYSRANQLALRVLPTEVIRGLREAHNIIQWPTMGNSTSPSTINLWAAAASSCNYLSGSHVDNDFFYSGLTVICHDDLDVTQSNGTLSEYRPNLPPAVHFCLPKKGCAIALRPGDFILFNPTEPHCVSMREKFYENKQVFLLSFYLRSAIVGRHDNSMPNDQFTTSESLDYAFDFNG